MKAENELEHLIVPLVNGFPFCFLVFNRNQSTFCGIDEVGTTDSLEIRKLLIAEKL